MAYTSPSVTATGLGRGTSVPAALKAIVNQDECFMAFIPSASDASRNIATGVQVADYKNETVWFQSESGADQELSRAIAGLRTVRGDGSSSPRTLSASFRDGTAGNPYSIATSGVQGITFVGVFMSSGSEAFSQLLSWTNAAEDKHVKVGVRDTNNDFYVATESGLDSDLYIPEDAVDVLTPTVFMFSVNYEVPSAPVITASLNYSGRLAAHDRLVTKTFTAADLPTDLANVFLFGIPAGGGSSFNQYMGPLFGFTCDLYSEEGEWDARRKTIFDTLKALPTTPITVEDN